MANLSKLTLAFVNKRPVAAARVLESLPVEDVAAFIETLPTRYAIKVLAALNTALGVQVVGRLTLASAAAVLRELEFVHATAILRQLPGDQRASVLAELPHKRRREFEKTLKFAADSVGARMSIPAITCTGDETVADALRRVKEDRNGHSEVVFVIDERRKVLGSVRISALARHRARTALQELLDNSCTPVSARARAAQVAAMAVWNEHSQLPVVSRRNELIGAIDKTAVMVRTHADETGVESGSPSVMGSLLQMLIATTPQIGKLVTATVQTAGKDGRGQ